MKFQKQVETENVMRPNRWFFFTKSLLLQSYMLPTFLPSLLQRHRHVTMEARSERFKSVDEKEKKQKLSCVDDDDGDDDKKSRVEWEKKRNCSMYSYTIMCVCIFNWETSLVCFVYVDGPLDLKVSFRHFFRCVTNTKTTKRNNKKFSNGREFYTSWKGNEPLTSRIVSKQVDGCHAQSRRFVFGF